MSSGDFKNEILIFLYFKLSKHIKLIAARKTVRLIAHLSNPNLRLTPTMAVPVGSPCQGRHLHHPSATLPPRLRVAEWMKMILQYRPLSSPRDSQQQSTLFKRFDVEQNAAVQDQQMAGRHSHLSVGQVDTDLPLQLLDRDPSLCFMPLQSCAALHQN